MPTELVVDLGRMTMKEVFMIASSDSCPRSHRQFSDQHFSSAHLIAGNNNFGGAAPADGRRCGLCHDALDVETDVPLYAATTFGFSSLHTLT